MFSNNGECTIANISGRERKRVEVCLKACGALSHDEGIRESVEAVSFNDTLGEIGKVVEGGLSEDRVIPVNSIDMYEVIADSRNPAASDRPSGHEIQDCGPEGEARRGSLAGG